MTYNVFGRTLHLAQAQLQLQLIAISVALSELSIMFHSCVPIDSICAVTIVWMIRGGDCQNCSVLCCIAQLYSHMYTHWSRLYTLV